MGANAAPRRGAHGSRRCDNETRDPACVRFAQMFQFAYDGHEVDFATVRNGKEVHELIEVKVSDSTPSKDLYYFAEKLKPKKLTQVLANPDFKMVSKNGVVVQSVLDRFSGRFFQGNLGS